MIKFQLHITVWITLSNIILQCGYTVSSLGRMVNLSIYHSVFICKMAFMMGTNLVKVKFQ